MAIPIKQIKEGCCDSDLNSLCLSIIDGDALDKVNPTCDKIVECRDKYVLVEEKSLLLGFFMRCCQELHKNLETYKYDNSGVTYLKISDVITLIHTLDVNVKERILAENTTHLLNSSLNKVSHTTHILATRFNSNKTANMPIFYLYCNSGKPIDRIMSAWLSRNNKKQVFIECTDLKSYLQRCC